MTHIVTHMARDIQTKFGISNKVARKIVTYVMHQTMHNRGNIQAPAPCACSISIIDPNCTFVQGIDHMLKP